MKDPASVFSLVHSKSGDVIQKTGMCLCVEENDKLLIEMSIQYVSYPFPNRSLIN